MNLTQIHIPIIAKPAKADNFVIELINACHWLANHIELGSRSST